MLKNKVSRNYFILVVLILITVLFCLHYVMKKNLYSITEEVVPVNREITSKWTTIDSYMDCKNRLAQPSRQFEPMSLRKIEDPELIIFVNSKVDDYEARCAIRATWSHHSHYNFPHIMPYKVYFQIGFKNNEALTRIQRENKLYQDILIFNEIPEKYDNIAKKLIASLSYLNKNLKPSIKFISKTDDDVYINMKDYLLHLKETIDVDYEGLLFEAAPVIHDINDKNYEPPHPVIKDTFRPFCSGRGYLIKVSKLDCLVQASKTHVNLVNGDTNIGYLLSYCKTTMKNNDDYNYKTIMNYNLMSGLSLLQNQIKFYFMHGMRRFDQVLFDMIFQDKEKI